MKPLIALFATAFLALASAGHAARLTDSPLVDPAWLADHLGAEGLVIVDVRDPGKDGKGADYAGGHVAGAVSAPYAGYGWRVEHDGIPGMLPPTDEIAARIGALGIDNTDHVVIVAQGADSTEFGKATRVYWTFKVLGHDAVSILDGGQLAWQAEGGAVTTDAATPQPAVFVASLRPDLIATTDQVAAAIADDVALVDGRPAAQYRGEEKSGVVRVAGTIPTAVNIEQSNFYQSRFIGADAVATLERAVGLNGQEKVITFCNTGHWASIAWFGISEVAGNKNTAMYDGSMAEWTRDESRPVE